MNIPIVFVHKGGGVVFNDTPFSYVNFATLQARMFNPRADVWVIGDQPCHKSLLPFHTRTENLEDYEEIINTVRAVYRHMSPNNEEIDMLCIARWFVLREWMQRHNVSRCLHLDTDVLLYDNASDLDDRFPHCMMTLCNGISGASSIVSKPALDAFCELVLRIYTSPDEVRDLELLYERECSKGKLFGILDMTFLGMIGRDKPSDFLVVTPTNTDPAIDNNINEAEGYQLNGGIKRIEFVDGLPHGLSEVDALPRRFALLHFQSGAKRHMQDYLHCAKGAEWCAEPLLHLLKHHWQRIGESAIVTRSLSNRIGRQTNNLKNIRKKSHELRDNLRKLTQSSWIKMGHALRVTSARATLAESSRLTEEIKSNART